MSPGARSVRSPLVAAFAAAVLIGAVLLPVTGRAQLPQAVSVSVRQGTCERLGGTVFDVGTIDLLAASFGTPEVGDPIGMPAAVPVATGSMEIGASRDALVNAPHSLAVAAGADGQVIACGGIGVPRSDSDELFFGLTEQESSGYAGIARIDPSNGGGGATVTVYLAEGLTGAPGLAGTPVVDGDEDAVPAEEVTVEMVDIDFNPNEFTIPAETNVLVRLPNLGEIVHNFHVDPLDVHSEDVQPGGETTVTINAEAGDYEYYCSIPGHREAGMVGTLHVE